MTRSRIARCTLASAVLASTALVACGAGQSVNAFSEEWQNDQGISIERVRARLSSVELPTGAAVAVGVTRNGLAGVGLDGKNRWGYAGPIEARPVIAGDVVVLTGGGNLTALDATTGKELWQVSTEGRELRGAGDDGHTTVATLGNARGGESLFLAVGRDGKVIRRFTPDKPIGSPAVIRDVAFVPWENQYVSAIDLGTGNEVGRLLTRTQVSRATVIGGELYFGEAALIKFDDAIGKASRDQAHEVTLPERELPGKPRWHTNGSDVLAPAANANDKVQIFARPSDANPPGVDSERFAATYFKVALGFHSTDGALSWVHTFPSDIVGGAAARGGFVFCDENGKIWFLGAKGGASAGTVSLGIPVLTCLVQAGELAVQGESSSGPLLSQITHAIETTESDMLTIQRFLLREAAMRQEPEITELLIKLASDARTPPALAADARDQLASRRSGAEYMLDALKRRYDFLEGVLRPPPVGPLADALAAMNESRAAPLLAEQLNEPANSPDDVQRAAKALVTLGTIDELDEIRTFFSLYRGTATDEHMVSAVVSAARALVRLGGPPEAEFVRHAANDPLTVPAVKQGIANLAPEPAPKSG